MGIQHITSLMRKDVEGTCTIRLPERVGHYITRLHQISRYPYQFVLRTLCLVPSFFDLFLQPWISKRSHHGLRTHQSPSPIILGETIYSPCKYWAFGGLGKTDGDRRDRRRGLSSRTTSRLDFLPQTYWRLK